MKKGQMSIRKGKILSLYIFFVSYIIWFIIYSYFENEINISKEIIFYASWIGIITLFIYLYFWKKITTKFYNPINIFLMFFAVFNFGQCFLWAFGIHSNQEIGNKLIFSTVSADNISILKSQLIFIISLIALNTGFILIWNKNNYKNIPKLSERKCNERNYKILFIASVVISLYAIPCTLYKACIRLIYSQMYSYHDLYYGAVSVQMGGALVDIGYRIFPAAIIGMLIGSKYSKKTVIFSYSTFFVYAILTLICGDRGEWIKPLAIIIWAHITLYKPVSNKKMIKYSFIIFILLYLISPFKALRNTGLSLAGYIEALNIKNNNIIQSMLLEFGNSMGISIILIKEKVFCPYGNTFIMSFLTMFGTGIFNRIFNMNYVQLHTWFPRDFLKINYGCDFSIIGEVILNYGEHFTPFIILIEGILIGIIFSSPYRKNDDPLWLCLSISSMIIILGIVRSTAWTTLSGLAQLIMIFSISYFLIKLLLQTRRK